MPQFSLTLCWPSICPRGGIHIAWTMDMALRTRAVHQFLQVCMYRTGRHSVSHVRAHRGTIGNEIADMLANRIRTKLLKSRPLPRHYAEWFHGNPAKILRAGLVMDTNIRPAELPELRDDCLTFSPAERLGQTPHLASFGFSS